MPKWVYNNTIQSLTSVNLPSKCVISKKKLPLVPVLFILYRHIASHTFILVTKMAVQSEFAYVKFNITRAICAG